METPHEEIERIRFSALGLRHDRARHRGLWDRRERGPQARCTKALPPRPSTSPCTAEDEARVQAFHAAALTAGGTDNGEPGLRPQYHAGYYAAYVKDPDGNNLEAVFRGNAPSV